MKHGCFAAIALMIVFSAGTTWAAQSGTISVVVASFGLSCGANARGNYTDLVKSACDGQTNCSFGDIGARGDPYPGCQKSFDVTWTCSGQQGQKSVHIESVDIESVHIGGEPSVAAPPNLYCPF